MADEQKGGYKYVSWCKHYTGYVGARGQRTEACGLGIPYASVRVSSGDHPMQALLDHPCTNPALKNCNKAEHQTRDEVIAEVIGGRLKRIFRLPTGELVLKSRNEILSPGGSKGFAGMAENGRPRYPTEAEWKDATEPTIEERQVFLEAITQFIDAPICTRNRTEYCQTPGHGGRRSVARCDYPVSDGTCDRRMCEGCRRPVAGQPDKDYCQAHDKLAKASAPK